MAAVQQATAVGNVPSFMAASPVGQQAVGSQVMVPQAPVYPAVGGQQQAANGFSLQNQAGVQGLAPAPVYRKIKIL